jgi:putative FmdB family regulatory protein
VFEGVHLTPTPLSWEAMANYEYLCLACEHPFEERRSMAASGDVDTQLACPECGSERVRRRFSIFAAGSGTGAAAQPGMSAPPSASGGCCGGGCACGG